MEKHAPFPARKVLSRPPVYTLLNLLLDLEQMQVRCYGGWRRSGAGSASNNCCS